MILWNRDRMCDTNPDAEDRADVADDITTTGTKRLVFCLNIAVNVVVLGVVIAIFGFNLAAFAVAYVLTDMFLTVLDHVIFIAIPRWRTMNSSLSTSQKRIEDVQEKYDALKKKVDDFQCRECDNCRRRHYSCHSCYNNEYYDMLVMEQFLCEEKDWVAAQLTEIKEEEIKTDERKSKDYSDKTEYFTSVIDKLEYFEKTHQIQSLAHVLTSIRKLNNTLSKNQTGYSLVPGTLYAYLDELQSVLNKWIDLNEKQKARYEKDIERIAVALGKHIHRLNERIGRLQTEDIEVGITVLLNELAEEEKKEEGNNV